MTIDRELSLAYLVHRITARMVDAGERHAKEHGLRLHGARVLVQLLEREDQRVGDLAVRMAMEQSSLSHILKRMNQSGFVTRNRLDDDNRVVVVSLTNKGRLVAKLLESRFSNYDPIALRGFNNEEAELLKFLLMRVFENVQEIDKEPGSFEASDTTSARQNQRRPA